ncbi:MAG: class I SAM-dependent methyltransferase [Syntrophomonadaceae bacterium]
MDPKQYFEIFEKEVTSYDSENSFGIKNYYKFSRRGAFYFWRKAYLLQRLEYIYSNIVKGSDKSIRVWDVGCGYGTSSLFLAMNGIRSVGLTLEYYHNLIPLRKNFWKEYGNTDLFEVMVENLYEVNQEKNHFDFILVQDTLHHLEPIDQAMQIFSKSLKDNGQIIIVDDNGNNIMQRAKLYMMRGNKRIIDYYDENLKRKIPFGNENVRSFKQWKEIFERNGFNISNEEYIRFLPPLFISESNYHKAISIEQKIWRKSGLLKEGFYWGLNFIGSKK